MVWHGFRISAIPPLPAHQLSQKPESIVVLKTIALCCAQTIATQRTHRRTQMLLENKNAAIYGGGGAIVD
jgi:hypothetical protein